MQTKSSLACLPPPPSLCQPFLLLPPKQAGNSCQLSFVLVLLLPPNWLCLCLCRSLAPAFPPSSLPPSFSFLLPLSPCSCYAFIAIVVAVPAVMLIIYIARAQHDLRNCRTVCTVPLFPFPSPDTTPDSISISCCCLCVGAKKFDLPAAILWSALSVLSICCHCCFLLFLLFFIKTQWAVRDKRKRWIHCKHRYHKVNININMQINTYHMSQEYRSIQPAAQYSLSLSLSL